MEANYGMTARVSSPHSAILRRYKVLLVEDDASVANMYQLGLELGGYLVVIAPDGEQALDQASGPDGPDVMILDLGLPRRDGLEVLSALRDRPLAHPMPILVLSNRSTDFGDARRLGAEDCLVKSLTTPSQLLKKVEEMVSRGRHHPQLVVA